MMFSYNNIADLVMGIYYAFMAYEIIRRVITVETKMSTIDDLRDRETNRIASIGKSRFGVEREMINEQINERQNTMRYNIYKKIALSLLLTLLPFAIKSIYRENTQKEIGNLSLAAISISMHLIMHKVFEMDFTKEELEFIDN